MVGTATEPAVIFLHCLSNLVTFLLNVPMMSGFTADGNFTLHYKCITIKMITVTKKVTSEVLSHHKRQLTKIFNVYLYINKKKKVTIKLLSSMAQLGSFRL